MDSGEVSRSKYRDSISKRIIHKIDQQEHIVMQYTAGLKALLDVLPDDVECLSNETVENYLWVIEILLQAIYDGLNECTDGES